MVLGVTKIDMITHDTNTHIYEGYKNTSRKLIESRLHILHLYKKDIDKTCT